MRAALIVSMVLLVGCSQSSGPVASNAPVAPASQPPPAIQAGDPVEGQRVAIRVGCRNCHGEDGSGRKLWGEKGKYQLVSPNLTVQRNDYDDAGIEALLRQGKTSDGHPIFWMPIVMFQHLSDREIRDITAWLRSLPAVADHEKEKSWFSDDVAKQIQAGTYPDQVATRPDPAMHAPATPPSDPMELGKHLAMSSCIECHGPTLDGWPGDNAPPLAIAKAYSLQQFTRLMRTGITMSGKESATGLMSEMGRERFPAMTDAEVRDLKRYLDSR